jgi:hypothetical protein
MRREIWLGQSRGACVARWQLSPRYDTNHLCFTGVRSACPVAMLFVTCLDLSLLCPPARIFAFVEARAIRWLNLTWIRATIDGIVAIQFLLAAQNVDEKTA